MAATGSNYIDFVSELIYGDLGVGELTTAAPAGALNHIQWTRDHVPNSVSSTVTGDEFVSHHLDYMLSRYEAWHSKYLMPPVRPWDGSSSMDAEQSATIPGGALPATVDALGDDVRDYYNNTYRALITDELADEVKAPYSFRYWAFMKWASDLRKRVLGQPVIHVHKVIDRHGTVLSEKDFSDIFHQVHHVWHPNGAVGSGWTEPTPFFKTSAGQHIGKKEISRTQVGAEFFTFHRDHLELFDRWAIRAGQDPIQAINTCAHDTDPNDPVPAGVDADSSGYPHIEDWSTNPPTVIFNDVHTTYWEGDLNEVASVGELGQLFAMDFNQFSVINVPGVFDTGYHGTGHLLNGDLYPPVDNNHSPRFFAWHGMNDAVWQKREPRLDTFQLVQSDNTDYPAPGTLTILRDLGTSTDTTEPALGVDAIDLTNGQGTLRVKANVRSDPFSRPLELILRCEILREGTASPTVIALEQSLDIIASGAPGAGEQLQGTDFFEDFVFDGSAPTVDGDGDGPFRRDNDVFLPTPVGFKNSRIRVSGYVTCTVLPDGTTPTVSGTLSSVGTAVTGTGTSFQTELRQGDLIRAGGQVRMVIEIASNTSLTLLEAFDPDVTGASYERLDGFDHESVAEITMIEEKDAPEITSYLNRSTFSVEQVDAAGTTVFDDAFYVVVQDRADRPFTITWPATVEPALYGLIAPPIYAAGLYTDLVHAPLVELRDATTNDLINDVVVEVIDVQPEDPSLHPAIPQRITCPCRVTFTGQGAFTGLVNPGDIKDVKLVVTAVDRAGNQIVDDSLRVRLQVNPNPFMLDGETHWLSVDTRVFQIDEGQARFGVAGGWSDPVAFIQQVIANFRTGSGTAGGETFDSLLTDQGDATLEYSTSVGGNNVYNFTLAQVHLESAAGLADLRATFRLFRWGTANVEFDDTLAYRSAVSGIGLLGQTTTAELASIPFFAEDRVSSAADMDTQTDATNLFTFAPTGGSEVLSYFGAYLDINQTTLRFPQNFVGDGPFAGSLNSIRDLLEDHHQCMVVELLHSGDPTVAGSTPGTSDNLAQRNLLIVETANPGSEITRMVLHSFDIDLHRSLQHPRKDRPPVVDAIHLPHAHSADEPRRPPTSARDTHHDTAHDTAHNDNQADAVDTRSPRGLLLGNARLPVRVRPAQPADASVQAAHVMHSLEGEQAHLRDGWIAQSPDLLKRAMEKLDEKHDLKQRWTIDLERWKPTTGLDELAFFWNNLPQDSEVELYLPTGNVEQIFNFRSLRHAPETVRIVDSQTLRLYPVGTTYLPIANLWGDHLSGQIRVKLPPGIKKGQEFRIDVVQMRADEARTLGGFQVRIQVQKAAELWEAENRALTRFHKRLSLKTPDDRWRPIVERQVEFARARARGLVELANQENPGDEPIVWADPTEKQKGRKVRVILEKIRIDDDCEPFFKGKGEFRFAATVWTPNNGGTKHTRAFPQDGHYHLGDTPGNNELALSAVLFDGWVEDRLAVQVGGVELDTFDPDDRLNTYRRVFTGDPAGWFGRLTPTGSPIDLQDMGGWRIWLRVEASGS